ncbi:MAG: glycosyltransferase family 4 protein [Deltaproteobacteria bacterium]|nr:MAG: glycosyltransferase family 4 protein [Deltaproteobacteria bacterium]
MFLLMEGLRRRGHDNVLLCPAGSRSEREARERGIACRAIPARTEWNPANVWRVRAALRAAAPDLVHLHTGRANWLGGLAARPLHVPVITTRRMDRAVKRNVRTRLLYGSLVRRAVAISGAIERQLLAGGVRASMVRVIPSAVDAATLRPQRTREAVRAAEGLDAETPCLLLLAALVRRKGIDVLLEALARLAQEGLEPALWIAGEGPERGALERRAGGLGVSARVRFLGQRADRADLLAACDVVVLPSRQEGLGVAALEAMALARPVVATRVGGLGEAVVHERTGLLVPPDDVRALAEALARLLRDASLRESLGAAGPARLAQGYRPDQMVDAYERLYREVLAEVEGP